MLTFTQWPRSLIRIGLVMLLTGLLTLALLILSAPGVSATSLVSTGALADDAVAREPDQLHVVLATTDGPMTAGHILFIEQNVLVPDYDAADGSSADRPLRYDEIRFLGGNWVLVSRNQSTYGSDTSTNWLGLSDLELIDEPRLHHLVPPKVTSSETNWLGISDLELIDEPRFHHLVPPAEGSPDDSLSTE